MSKQFGQKKSKKLILACSSALAISAIGLCLFFPASRFNNFYEDSYSSSQIDEKVKFQKVASEKYSFLNNNKKIDDNNRIAPPSSAPPGSNMDEETPRQPIDNLDSVLKVNGPAVIEEFQQFPLKPILLKPSQEEISKEEEQSRILGIQEFLASNSNLGKLETSAQSDQSESESILKQTHDQINKIRANCVYYWHSLVDNRPAWVWTMLCSLLVMSTGIVPAFLIPWEGALEGNPEAGQDAQVPAIGAERLNRLLSFAVGSLLGDVFFHLLPESWVDIESSVNTGLLVIAGLLSCIIIEKFCAHSESSQHYIAALANLAANIMDNFTHGLAVGGSFLVSTRLGFLTTFAILIHEIPHEISDFAILLRADFNRWAAIKAQMFTAAGGLLGAAVAMMDYNHDQKTNWILPFTAGGFLNIALVQVLPDLMKETRAGENVKQMLTLLAGIAVMAVLNTSFHV